ncbi:DUF1292 domain-containing protein [Filifactor villosus]|uniref:DUF1292 domain-containing protein n=1 Tax=Filifactor villosus TaxID=29374 RepID=A0ABV9QMH3_9FIRM
MNLRTGRGLVGRSVCARVFGSGLTREPTIIEERGIWMDETKGFVPEDEDVKIHIVTDEGEELECSVIGIFELDEYEYIAMVPGGTSDLYLYRYEETEEGIELDSIEDMDEMSRVETLFFELFGDEDDMQD